ncbi:MAG TPA: DUF4375 domain-containing protein [Gemmatimonadaceae bacterium]|nr:DUF4375 domain-containing protein [Gemmatimonadaceae bacterium]
MPRKPLTAATDEELARRVARALRMRTPKSFFDALYDTQEGFWGAPYADVPEILRMAKVLTWLGWDISSKGDGIADFLKDQTHDAGAYAREAVEWCREIGAKRAAAYVAGAVALLPRGRVPAKPLDRMVAVFKMEQRKLDAFAALDRKYRGTDAELAERLRAYLREHRDELVEALSRTQARVLAPPVVAGALTPVLDEEKEGLDFWDALHDVMSRLQQGWPDAEAQPETAEMVTVLYGIWMDVGNEGLWSFLDSALGPDLSNAARWCRKIKAKETATYLEKAVKLFPGGRVPEDEQKRIAVIEAIEERGDPFGALDDQYRDVMRDELPARLRDYLRANQAKVEATFEPRT